jgi:hypothetical protein
VDTTNRFIGSQPFQVNMQGLEEKEQQNILNAQGVLTRGLKARNPRLTWI